MQPHEHIKYLFSILLIKPDTIILHIDPAEFPFSIVLSIEETIRNNSGKLYDEIQLINQLEVMQELDIDAGLEADELDV